MVIVRLSGGIGNQMFQYATARRISYINNVPLKLDLGWFHELGWWTQRKYELGAFLITDEVASPDEVEALKSEKVKPSFSCLPDFLKKKTFHKRHTYIIEKSYNFDPEILNLKGDIYLDGHWQSEKYFSDIEPLIRREFSFRDNPEEPNRRILDRIVSCESVSVHVRRGDYVTLPKARAFHGLCPLVYYQTALYNLLHQLKHPVCFVFSDDISWAKENLQFDIETHFIDHNGPEFGHEDLRLMSACSHHIIANSSFSWWGAWLCNNPQKIVYVPQKWFNNNIETPDNIPQSWVRL